MSGRTGEFLFHSVSIVSIMAFILGFIPFVNLIFPYFGGLAVTYLETYGILEGTFAGFVVGIASTLPMVIYILISVVVLDGAVLAVGGLIGVPLVIATFILNPFFGAAGGFSLGVLFHLIDRGQA